MLREWRRSRRPVCPWRRIRSRSNTTATRISIRAHPGTLLQTVNRADTTTTVTSSANPSVVGQLVTFTATVASVAPGAGIPSGAVAFKDGSTTLGTGTLDATGKATL